MVEAPSATPHPSRRYLIEPTSGNTGIGIAWPARCAAIASSSPWPEKIPREAVVLEALGAEIIPHADRGFVRPRAHQRRARLQQKRRPTSSIRIQTRTTARPRTDDGAGDPRRPEGQAHDLWARHRGSSPGVARALNAPGRLHHVGADSGRIDSRGRQRGRHYKCGSIGYDFNPQCSIATDRRVGQDHRPAIIPARAPLIREEGLLVGGSSGSAMFAHCRRRRPA